MNFWPIIIVSGLLTFATRLSFIAAHGRIEMPRGLTRALAFVPMAVLSAIILPDLVAPHGSVDLSLGNARWLAGLIALGVAWRTKNVWLTISSGMIVLFAIELLSQIR